MSLRFEIFQRAADCGARLGRVTTPHGSFDTPAFMPVGTRASVKGLLPAQVERLGSQIILANTYHLMLRPGSELVAAMGGLHAWMRWPRPILTDSGGFQVFSLADAARITDDGVTFRSEIDGRMIELTPEQSMRVQNELGADIIMAFDDCPPAAAIAGDGPATHEPQQPPAEAGGSPQDTCANSTENPPEPSPQNHAENPRLPPGAMGAGAQGATNAQPKRHAVAPADYSARVRQACERSLRWLDRCVAAHARPDEQALFGIVQGGTDLDQRTWCADRVAQHDLPGYAIGGVAVGEGYAGLKRVVEHTAPLLPDARPRYLMGVGYERDLLTAVRAGVDMFDCVLPTRNGRNANAFTPTGQVRLRNARFAEDEKPIDPSCDCPACGGGFSRSYLRHLFMAGEMLGPILVSMHNIRHYHRFMLDIRKAVAHNDWSALVRAWPVCAEA